MQLKEPIEKSLLELQCLYEAAMDSSHKAYYSKLALMELCGWLEEVYDEMLLNFCSTRIIKEANMNFLSKDIIGRIHGCSYGEHFRPMLIKVLGIVNVEKLETVLDSGGELTIMSSVAGALSSLRKKPAHSSTIGTMPTLESPGVIISKLNSIYPVLERFEAEINTF